MKVVGKEIVDSTNELEDDVGEEDLTSRKGTTGKILSTNSKNLVETISERDFDDSTVNNIFCIYLAKQNILENFY